MHRETLMAAWFGAAAVTVMVSSDGKIELVCNIRIGTMLMEIGKN